MELTEKAVNDLVDDLSLRLGGGTLVVYGKGADTGAPFSPLVSVRLRMPAFEPAINGRAHVLPLEKTLIEQSGDADQAQVFTASGELVSKLTIGKSGTAQGRDADIVVNDTRLTQFGEFGIDAWALRLA